MILEFRHSIYGKPVRVTYEVFDNCLRPVELSSESEAVVSYYTDNYFYDKNKKIFLARIDYGCVEKIRINENWLIALESGKVLFNSGSRILEVYVCGAE